MDTYRRGPTWSQIVFGLALILVGVLYTLDNMHVIDAHEYVRYWPVLLIVFGLARIVDPHRRGGRFFGLIVAGFGVFFLLRNFGSISWNIGDLWPLILALVGLNILWHAFVGRPVWGCRSRRYMRFTMDDGSRVESGDAPAVSSPEPFVDVQAHFGENTRVVSSQDFRGGKVNVSMGSVRLDLRQATIAADQAVLDVHTVMGGVEIRVPESWNVIPRLSSVLGGVDDKTHKPPAGAKTLIITGETVLGGIEVKN